jgi:hypothetical protein
LAFGSRQAGRCHAAECGSFITPAAISVVSLAAERSTDTLNSQPDKSARIEFAEFLAALAKLPAEHRLALILVGT